MSLHLGNLSSRVHRDEVEHVFQRFGKCTVQLKDKFGFVIYDLPSNAEKALRTLRGKKICGERIFLSWSNRQPRPIRRFVRGGRSYEWQQGRNSAREDYVNRKLDSDGHQDDRAGIKQPNADGGRSVSIDLVDEATSYHQDTVEGYVGQSGHFFREHLPSEGGRVEPNLLDSDRWEEQAGLLSNDDRVENKLDFERYEPYHGDDRKDNEDETHLVTHSDGSPASKKMQETIGVEEAGDMSLNPPGKANSQRTCYNCGKSGHKMQNCPREEASQGKKLSRFTRRRHNEVNYRSKGEGVMQRSKSQDRLQTGRDALSTRKNKSDRKESSSRMHRSEHSPWSKETYRSRKKEYSENKRNKRQNGSPARHQAKKLRGTESSPVHFDYNASRSRSRPKSQKSAYGSSSGSKLRLASSRSASISSSSTSDSRSHRYRSTKSKVKMMSTSSSPTALSSVPLGQALPPSPNKAQINQKYASVNVASLEYQQILVEREQQVEGEAGFDNFKLDSMTDTVETQITYAPVQGRGDMDKDLPDRNDEYDDMSRDTLGVTNSCTLGLDGHLAARSLSPHALREMRELECSDACEAEDHMLISTKNLDSEVSARCHASTSITPEEMYMVLKHYGMEPPENHAKDLPVEAYFGSARLWPWEIIYYRRLRKGPISTENYAQRIAQNKEFDIVDKYIRSSSGWGESR